MPQALPTPPASPTPGMADLRRQLLLAQCDAARLYMAWGMDMVFGDRDGTVRYERPEEVLRRTQELLASLEPGGQGGAEAGEE